MHELLYKARQDPQLSEALNDNNLVFVNLYSYTHSNEGLDLRIIRLLFDGIDENNENILGQNVLDKTCDWYPRYIKEIDRVTEFYKKRHEDLSMLNREENKWVVESIEEIDTKLEYLQQVRGMV